jgi:tetratricopeptide (TPR) repeat protein
MEARNLRTLGLGVIALFFAGWNALNAYAEPPVKASRLERVHGVWVMDLYGTREEMAYRHGELIQNRLHETALPYFASKIQDAIAQTYIVRDHPSLTPLFQSAIDLVAQEPLRNQIPHEDQQMLRAFARGAGLNEKATLNAWILPDAGQWLTATLFGKNKIRTGFYASLPVVSDWGCSSLVATRSRSRDGLLHARNLDYEGFGIFDQATLLTRYFPTEPNAQKYISIGALGLHQAGITSMNESGIILTLHQAMVTPVSLFGTPILSANERVIRQARSLDEAVQILASLKHAGAWRIILSSAIEDRALLVEVSARGTFVVEDSRFDRETAPQGLLLATNHVLSSSLQENEFAINYRYADDTRKRLRALQELSHRILSSEKKAFDLQEAIDSISSSEAFSEEGDSSFPTSHGIISKMNNIQSVVFEPQTNRVWIARAPEETPWAKPVQGVYISFPLFRNTLTPPLHAVRRPTLPVDTARQSAHALYRQAAVAATEHSQFKEAAMLYLQAAQLEPSEGLYLLVAGLSFFQAGDFQQSQATLEQAMKLNLDTYHRAIAHLFLGRSADLIGTRAQALAHYAQVTTGLSKPLDAATLKAKKKPFKKRDARKVVLDAVQADLFRW